MLHPRACRQHEQLLSYLHLTGFGQSYGTGDASHFANRRIIQVVSKHIRLQAYRLRGELGSSFDNEFKLLLSDVDLENLDREEIAKLLPKKPGCYFWVLNIDDARYRIYVGSTSSVRRRITDYSNEFQIHSPNDFKIRFFQYFTREELPYSKLDLYFAEISPEHYKIREKELVRLYRPLINERAKATREEKAPIKSAYGEYYSSVFRRKLG